jgi:lipid II:glycine glycyltransferase (peptidoglycan interpeptide bridge formation enzyme)
MNIYNADVSPENGITNLSVLGTSKMAIGDGVTIKSGRDADLLSDYIRMDTETWARSNRAASGLNFYASKIEALPRNTKVFIAYKDGVPQSGAFIYYDNTCGYYMFGANTNSPYTGSGNLLQWEIMLWLKQQGVKKYSFVGCRINEDESSKYHSIQRFKERFGGNLIQGYMFKCVCNKMMFKIFRLIMHLRGSSGVDAIDQEICKWRELN